MDFFKLLKAKNNRSKQVEAQSINAKAIERYPSNEEIAIMRKTLKKLTELHPEIDFTEFNNYFNTIEGIKQEVKEDETKS